MVTDTIARTHMKYWDAKYRDNPREGDKIILSMLEGKKGSLLDIGCSEGTLLRHIEQRHPHLELHGADFQAVRIDAAKESGINAKFSVMDITSIKGSYDIIVANAVFFFLDADAFRRSCDSVHGALRKGGCLIAFDFFSPYEQDLAILENSREHKDHPINIRSMRTWTHSLKNAGFSSVNIKPFDIPIDLPLDHSQVIKTHTVKTGNGDRLQFRGAIFQPWGHLIAST